MFLPHYRASPYWICAAQRCTWLVRVAHTRPPGTHTLMTAPRTHRARRTEKELRGVHARAISTIPAYTQRGSRRDQIRTNPRRQTTGGGKEENKKKRSLPFSFFLPFASAADKKDTSSSNNTRTEDNYKTFRIFTPHEYHGRVKRMSAR